MKPIKILGLAAMAALLAMAFAGVSSAMAEGSTSLCKVDQNPCEAANQVSHVHETTTTKATLLGSSNPECDVLFLGDVTKNAQGNYLSPVTIDEDEERNKTELTGPLQILGTFTYSSCNGECTAKEENGPTEIPVLRTGVELATVTSGEGTWAGLVNLVCTVFKISCKYVGTGLEGHALGPLTSSALNGSVTLSEQVTVEEGEKSLCPNNGKLDITTTPLEKTYIKGMAATTTSLCKADENPCSGANQVSHVHETTTTKATLLGSSNPECDVLFLGDVTKNAQGNYLSPVTIDEDEEGNKTELTGPLQILGTFTYSSCNGECTAKEENGPTEIPVLRTGVELATVTSGEGTWAGLVNLVCTVFKISCKYVGTGLEGHALGPLTSSALNGSVTLSEQVTVEEGEKSLCPNNGKLDITTTPLEKVYIST